MSNVNLKLNLMNLHAVIQTQKGKLGPVECLVIPIEKNNLFKGKSGLYLDLVAFELKEKKNGQTHLIKQSFPKEIYEAMTEEQKQATPILGNISEWDKTEKPPVSDMTPVDELSDLPFILTIPIALGMMLQFLI